jgi:hypothetical protein
VPEVGPPKRSSVKQNLEGPVKLALPGGFALLTPVRKSARGNEFKQPDGDL